MKIILFGLILLITGTVSGQTILSSRKIVYHTFPKDSINLHLSPDYFLIEDSCSSIIRYGHVKLRDRIFYGPFKDVNKLNPSIIVAEGMYTPEGKLDGPFKSHFLNGDLQAEGTFDKGIMVGKWVLYYAGNRKKLVFENSGSSSKVMDFWDEQGKQLVTDGKGSFQAAAGNITWEGKLLDGKPDGTWRSRRADDRTNTILSSENHKNGMFIKGNGGLGGYNDQSRIHLINEEILPINNVTLFRISANGCDPSLARKRASPALYKEGSLAFREEIVRLIGPIFSKIDLTYHASKQFTIEGIIDEKGKLNNLKYVNTFDDRASTALLTALYRLPFLEPALLDDVPVKSKFTMTFVFSKNQYSYTYRFMAPDRK